jgi:peptide/nickel transport system ATP-binding protein
MSCLELAGVRVYFATGDGPVRAVDEVDLTVRGNEILGLVGESGCGKTVLALSIVRLLPKSASTEGCIRYGGMNLLDLSENAMRSIRGKEIALMLQNPATSLDPLMRIQEQVTESILAHSRGAKKEARARSLEVLQSVGIPPERAREYPHEFSGGMRQRAALAVAMALEPSVLIADEPTKTLDGPRKRQVLTLIERMQRESGASVLFITHDLPAASAICHRMAVMYAGEVVEVAASRELFEHPLHFYTRDLLKSLPRNGFKPVAGAGPSLLNLPSGCRFHPRCARALTACSETHPAMRETTPGHFVRCLLHGSGESQGP